MRRWIKGGIYYGLIAVLAASPASPSPAEDSKPAVPADSHAWHFTVAPYAWALSLNGKIGVGKRDTTVDASFIDILRESNSLIGIEGHVEAQRDRFGFFFDGIYTIISASLHESAGDRFVTADLNVNVDTEMAILEAGGFYRVVDQYPLWKPTETIGGGTFIFDVLAGARYTYLGVSANTKLGVDERAFKRDVDGSHDWVDPFIGGRLMLGIADSVDFTLRGDIGGFGVGSDFTWNTQALVGYRFTLLGAKAEAWGGYRALSQDYTDGSGHKAFKWDVIMHGPVLGMSITW